MSPSKNKTDKAKYNPKYANALTVRDALWVELAATAKRLEKEWAAGNGPSPINQMDASTVTKGAKYVTRILDAKVAAAGPKPRSAAKPKVVGRKPKKSDALAE